MKDSTLILALDQGTTSSRAILFNRDLQAVAVAHQEFPQLYPQPGWVEHDPEALWQSQRAVMNEVLKRAGCEPAAVAALAVANQRETVVVWNRYTGQPVYNAIVWQCRRTADACSELKKRGLEAGFREKTGLVLDAYFSATKINWILDHVDGARESARRGDLLCGTIDTWLIWKLTGGKEHMTDFTNASRTLLFNIHTLRWDEDLLALFQPFVIQHEALDDELPQRLRRPDAEPRGLVAVDPVAHRDDGIQVVVLCRVSLPVRGSMFQNGTY